jgi:hypothetical protein
MSRYQEKLVSFPRCAAKHTALRKRLIVEQRTEALPSAEQSPSSAFAKGEVSDAPLSYGSLLKRRSVKKTSLKSKFQFHIELPRIRH